MFWLAKLGYSALATAIIGGGVASGVGIAKQFSKRHGAVTTNSANLTTPKTAGDKNTSSLGIESDGHSASSTISSLAETSSSLSSDSSPSVSPHDPASAGPASSSDPVRDPALTSFFLPASGPSSDSPTDLRDEKQVLSGEDARDPSVGNSAPSEVSLPAESPRELTDQPSDRVPHFETELPRNEEQHNDSRRDEEETELRGEAEDLAQRKEDEEEKVTLPEEEEGEEEVVEETVHQVETGNCTITDPLKDILESEGQSEGEYYSVSCSNKGISEEREVNIPNTWEGAFPKSIFKNQDWIKDKKLEIKVETNMEDGFTDIPEIEFDDDFPYQIKFWSEKFANADNPLLIGKWNYHTFSDVAERSGAIVKLVHPSIEKDVYLLLDLDSEN